jgi:hypothetical protein
MAARVLSESRTRFAGTRFVSLDIHKDWIRIAVAESGRSAAVEYLGEVANEPGAISKLCDRLGRPGKPLASC